MTLDNLMEIVTEIQIDKRLDELHKCPKCKGWINLDHVYWEQTDNVIPRMRTRVQCMNCFETVTLVLAGKWINTWRKRYG